jgi:hypothetical protein
VQSLQLVHLLEGLEQSGQGNSKRPSPLFIFPFPSHFLHILEGFGGSSSGCGGTGAISLLLQLQL